MELTAKEMRDFTLSNPPIPNHYSGQCFACVHPVGLKLQFWEIDGTIFTKYNIPTKYSGFQGLGHGGIIATLLDETSAWAISVNLRRLAVTQSFELKYLKPIYINTDIIVEGLIGSNEKSHVIVHAHIKNMNDETLVESNSTWRLPDKKTLAIIFNIDIEELEEVYTTFFNPIAKYYENKKKSFIEI